MKNNTLLEKIYLAKEKNYVKTLTFPELLLLLKYYQKMVPTGGFTLIQSDETDSSIQKQYKNFNVLISCHENFELCL